MQYLAPDALARARRVRLVIFDVDGVLTDGKLWYAPGGEELKAFHAFDAHLVIEPQREQAEREHQRERKEPRGAHFRKRRSTPPSLPCASRMNSQTSRAAPCPASAEAM